MCALMITISLLLLFQNVSGNTDNLAEYLERAEIAVKERFVEASLELHTEAIKSLKINYQSAFPFQTSNHTYAILDNRLFELIPEMPKLLYIQDIAEDHIAFVKAIESKGNVFVIIAFRKGDLELQIIHNNTTSKVQNFFIPDAYVVDADFFSQSDRLHLLVAYRNQRSPVPVIVYEWFGTYFDKTAEILMKGAKSVTTFTEGHKEILNIVQTDGLSVYEFSAGLKRVQNIHGIYEESLHIALNGTSYLLVLSNRQSARIYKWNGDYLEFLSETPTLEFIQKHTVHYIKNIPLIFSINNQYELTLHHLTTKGTLRTLRKFHFNNKISDVVVSFSSMVIISDAVVDIMPFSLKITYGEPPETNDELLNCMFQLEDLLDKNDGFLANETTNKSEPILLLEKLDSEEIFQVLETRLGNSHDVIQNFTQGFDVFNDSKAIMDKHVVIEGDLSCKRITVKNLRMDQLNGEIWGPNKWLSYGKNQTVDSTVSIEILETTNFRLPKGSFSKDVLLRNGNHIVTTEVTYENLVSSKAYIVKTINNISIHDIYMKSQPRLIEGIKIFDFLNSNTIKINHFERRITFHKNITIKDLTASNINGVNWGSFVESVFQFGKTTRIRGRIRLRSFKSNHLYARIVNEVEADEFFTLTTNQTIYSRFTFGHIDVNEFYTDNINGIEFKNMMTIDDDIVVHGPVTVDFLTILGNVEMNYTEGNVKIFTEEEHVIGTKGEDFLQIHGKKVKVVGNVFVEDISLAPNASLILNNEIYQNNGFDKYWSKSKDQTITDMKKINNLNARYLTLKQINTIPIENYLHNNSREHQFSQLNFKNITVLGNVYLSELASHRPDLNDINSTSVKYSGNFEVNGMKIFKNPIQVKNLGTKIYDSINVADAVTINHTGPITGKKTFENLVVLKDFTSNLATIESVNGKELELVQMRSLYVDMPANLSVASLNNLGAGDLNVERLNEIDLENYAREVEEVRNVNTLGRLTVFGNLTVKSAHNVFQINGIEMEPIVSIMNRGNDHYYQNTINCNAKFLGNVHTNNFNGRYINGYDFDALTSRLLYKDYSQNITANYFFETFKSSDLYTPNVNDVPLYNIIDTKSTEPQQIVVNSTLKFNCAEFHNQVHADNLQCDLNIATARLQNPKSRKIAYLDVTENVTLLHSASDLHRIITEAIVVNQNNVITKPVTFQHHLSAKNVQLDGYVNEINLNELAEDIVFKAGEQVISGTKVFPSLTLGEARSEANAEIPVINQVVVKKLNNSIVLLNESNNAQVFGKKMFFAGLQSEQLYTDFLNGVAFNQVVNVKRLKPIKNIQFNDIQIDNDLDLGFLNNINVTNVLRNTFMCNGSPQIVDGIYFFDEILILGGAAAVNINDIKPDDVVVDGNTQHLINSKYFVNTINFHGNITSKRVNGVNLIDRYNTAIVNGRHKKIRGDITCYGASTITANITTKSINSQPVSTVSKILKSSAPTIHTKNIQNIVRKVDANIIQSLKTISHLPESYLYIDRQKVLPFVDLSDMTGARVVSVGDEVLIHVERARLDAKCGLPPGCACPAQSTIHMAPDGSVGYYTAEGHQRVFSHEYGGVAMHLVAEGISRDAFCRNNSSNEISYLTWSGGKNASLSDASLVYANVSGYVSGVEFFEIDGRSFVVLCRYYDPILDSHDLGCMVLKFLKQFDGLELIQNIPLEWSYSTLLLHTAQGVTLIVSQLLPNNRNNSCKTQIYRFDTQENKFVLLRSITTTNHTKVVGVVLGSECLLILTENESKTLQIYKYVAEHDGYYYNQDFHLKAPAKSLSVFYTGGFGIGDAYLIVVTVTEEFLIYSYQNLEGWKLVSSGGVTGLKSLIPYTQQGTTFLFAPSSALNSVFVLYKHGA